MAEKLSSLVKSSRADAETPNEASPPQHRKELRARIASAWPILLLLAFLLLLWLLFGDRLAPARSVELGTVVTLRSTEDPTLLLSSSAATEADRYGGATLFQASGWIEAAPFPIRAVSLIDGTVAAVHVLQGETVIQEQLLANLVDDDARLNLATAEAALAESDALLEEAEAMQQATTLGLRTLELEVAAATARLEELQDESERLAQLGSMSVSERAITQAKLKTFSQQANILALKAQTAELEANVEARRAQSRYATHHRTRAQTEVARQQLALERTQIRSPIDGVVQRLHVAPGMKRMKDMDDPESSTIATLYQPERLQARIDVPLEAAARLSIGQAVRLRSSLLPDRQFEGSVTQIEGQADLQRNTLQTKVALHEPDTKLRPEMLCRAEFLAPPAPAGSATRSGQPSAVALYLPISALIPDIDAEPAAVWKLDATRQRVVRQAVATVGPARDGHLRVVEGLKPGDRVVLNPATDIEADERVATANAN